MAINCKTEDVLDYLPQWDSFSSETKPTYNQAISRISKIEAKILKIISSVTYDADDEYLIDLNAKGAAGWILMTAEMRFEGQVEYARKLVEEFEKDLDKLEDNLENYLSGASKTGENYMPTTTPPITMSEEF